MLTVGSWGGGGGGNLEELVGGNWSRKAGMYMTPVPWKPLFPSRDLISGPIPHTTKYSKTRVISPRINEQFQICLSASVDLYRSRVFALSEGSCSSSSSSFFSHCSLFLSLFPWDEMQRENVWESRGFFVQSIDLCWMQMAVDFIWPCHQVRRSQITWLMDQWLVNVSPLDDSFFYVFFMWAHSWGLWPINEDIWEQTQPCALRSFGPL